MVERRSGPPSRGGFGGGAGRSSGFGGGSGRSGGGSRSGGFGGGAGRGGSPRGESRGDRPSFGDRPPRREGGNDRPFGDRPQRSFSDRPPRRDGGGFGDRPRGDRPNGDRPGGDRPFGDRPPRREFNDRPPRSFDDRPKRDFGDRPPRRESGGFGDRPPRGDRPSGDRPGGDRPFGDRPPRREFNDRPPRRDGDESGPRRSFQRDGFGASRPRDGERPKREGSDDFRPPRREGFESRPPRREEGDRPSSDRPQRREYSSDRPQRSEGRRDAPPRNAGFGEERYERIAKEDAKTAGEAHAEHSHNPEALAVKGHEMLVYGVHAVQAALRNAARKVTAIWVTDIGHDHLKEAHDEARHPKPETMERKDIERRLPAGAVHQGIAVAVEPLDDVFLTDIIAAANAPDAGRHVVVVLDEVTDPHNVGAILRSMSMFGAKALIVHKRNAPSVTGSMAKTATGAIEHIPMVPVTNLSQAMEELKSNGFYCLGLDEDATISIDEAPKTGHIALVLGAEGEGLRAKTRTTCDAIASIPSFGEIKSLNVSNAAAIALYTVTKP
ncbi:MAG: ribose methyltransferase substrate binding family protein [Alphaproteobacteria bacterium]|nr:ribose methyltransferase substrate binding family protein [Alphaproteobacteria bacterium]